LRRKLGLFVVRSRVALCDDYTLQSCIAPFRALITIARRKFGTPAELSPDLRYATSRNGRPSNVFHRFGRLPNVNFPSDISPIPPLIFTGGQKVQNLSCRFSTPVNARLNQSLLRNEAANGIKVQGWVE